MSNRKQPKYSGFGAPTANFVYTPIQFFNVVLPNRSIHCVRLLSYLIRETLGWNNRKVETFTRTELSKRSGVTKNRVKHALEEALQWKLIDEPFPSVYQLRWSASYCHDPADFEGFFFDEANEGESRRKRRAIPNDFFDVVIRNETLSVIRVVGTLLYYSVGWKKDGDRRNPLQRSKRELSRLTHLGMATVTRGIRRAVEHGYLARAEPGIFTAGRGRGVATTFAIRWNDSYGRTLIPQVSPKDDIGLKVGTVPQMSPKETENHPTDEPQGVPLVSPKTHPTDEPNKQKTLELRHTQQGGLRPVCASLEKSSRKSSAEDSGLIQTLGKHGLSEPAAAKLLRDLRVQGLTEEAIQSRIERQVAAQGSRTLRNPTGALRQAILEDWSRLRTSVVGEGRWRQSASPADPHAVLEPLYQDFLKVEMETLRQDPARWREYERLLVANQEQVEKLGVAKSVLDSDAFRATQLEKFLGLSIRSWAKTRRAA